MTEWLVSLAQPLIAGLLMTVIASLFAALLYPLFRSVSPAVDPQNRALATWLYGLLPLLVALASLLLLLLPELTAVFMPDHCHGDNCAAHRPEFDAGSPVGIALLALTTTVLLGVLALARRSLLKTRQRLRALEHLSQGELGRSWRLVDSDRPLAWCAGILRPRLYLSRGLLATLDAGQLQAVLLHEQAHLLRRDNLRATALQWATVFWPPASRRQLWRDLQEATEASCDQMAARWAGDTGQVLAAVEKLARETLAEAPVPPGQYRGEGEANRLVDRIHYLQSAEPAAAMAVASWLIIALLGTAQVIVLPVLAHTTIEWMTL